MAVGLGSGGLLHIAGHRFTASRLSPSRSHWSHGLAKPPVYGFGFRNSSFFRIWELGFRISNHPRKGKNCTIARDRAGELIPTRERTARRNRGGEPRVRRGEASVDAGAERRRNDNDHLVRGY